MKIDSVEFYYSDSTFETMRLARKYGGGFIASLANTYCYADIHNRRKIHATWPELFEEYGPGGIFWGTEQKEES